MNPAVFRYGLTFAVVVFAALVPWQLNPILGDHLPFPTFFAAIAFAAWLGGWRTAGVAIAMGFLFAVMFFIPSGLSSLATDGPSVGGLAVYVVVGFILAGFGEATRTAQSLIAEQAERLRTTQASIGDAVIATNIEGRVTSMNPVAESLTGWSSREALGQPLELVFRIVDGSTRQTAANPDLRDLQEGPIVDQGNNKILIARDGVERPIEDTAAPILCVDGERVGRVLIFRDITDRKRIEVAQAERSRLTRLRVDVTTALAASQSTPVALQHACEAIVRHLEAAFARIWTLDETGSVLELQASAGLYTHLDGPHSRVPVGQYKIGRIAANRRPHLTNTVPEDPEVSDRQWAVREGMVAFAGYPLIVEDQVVGVVAMFSRQPLSDAVLTELAPLARGIAQFVDRRKIDAAFRRTAELQRVTLASIGDAVITTDAGGRVAFLNPVAESLTGWTTDEARGEPLETVFRIINESTRLPVVNPATRALQEGVIVGLANHTILVGREGTERPIDDSAAPIRARDGEIIGCVLVFRDVTERKQIEEASNEARRRLESTLAAGEVGTWEFDVVGNRVYADANLARMFGVTPDEAAGGPLEVFVGAIHPGDRARVAAAIGRVLESGSTFEAEYRIVGPNDHVRWVVARGQVLRNESGRATRLPGVIVDISGQRAAEQKLRVSEEQRRLALDAAELGAWNIDPATSSLKSDEMFQRIFRGSVGDMSFEEAFAMIHPGDRDRIRVAVTAAMQPASPLPYAEEYRVIHSNGAVRWGFGKGRANFDGDRIVSFDGTVADITARKYRDDELRNLAADLSTADHLKDEFLAMLAHELRNPLAPIRNGLQVMQLAKDDAETVELCRVMMKRQLDQLVRLVDDLMDVSRISRGKLELKKEPVSLTAVIDSAVETSGPLIDQMNHQLTVKLPERPVFLDADLTRLAQVFLNLLNNSAKYSEPGGQITLTAEVILPLQPGFPQTGNTLSSTSEESGAYRLDRRTSGLACPFVEVAVRDTGIGIAADQLPRVFDLFSQVDRSLEKSQGGLGIGLSLVQRLVEMHGGRVEARSEGPGRGSEFVVRLPIIPDGAAQTPIHDVTAPSSNLRILIVDDNHDSADSLAMMLQAMGNQVRTAYDGEEAVAAVQAFAPNVILLDIGLPKLNGYEACRRIREQTSGQDLVIIAQTGWGQSEDRQRTSEAGFDQHLVKPVDPKALMALLAEISRSK